MVAFASEMGTARQGVGASGGQRARFGERRSDQRGLRRKRPTLRPLGHCPPTAFGRVDTVMDGR